MNASQDSPLGILLSTDRLLLREFQETDTEAACALWSDPEVVRHMSFEPMTSEQVTAHVRKLIATGSQQPRHEYHFAVVRRDLDRMIGWCALRVHDTNNREANIGYALCQAYWGNSYTTEAARALLAWAFDQLGLHRVCARCVPENLASVHVIEKIGMKREGHKRKHRWIKGAWWDSLEHAMLDEEWKS